MRTLFFLLCLSRLFAVPQYYCTGASGNYYPHLLNLIGSLHRTNFENLETIAVFDLGLRADQVEHLKRIKKVEVFSLKDKNPGLTTHYILPNGRRVFGWFAWKPVAIKESLERFPYVLWVDAATTIYKPLDDLFEAIKEEGYFLATIGAPQIPLSWGATTFVKDQFHLNDPENRWILDREFVLGGVIGVAQEGQGYFLDTLVELTHDLRYYADDGTTPDGFGTARHDQTLLGTLAYLRGLRVYPQDPTQVKPMKIGNNEAPLYITWDGRYVSDDTHIHNSRGDLRNLAYHLLFIQYTPLISPE